VVASRADLHGLWQASVWEGILLQSVLTVWRRMREVRSASPKELVKDEFPAYLQQSLLICTARLDENRKAEELTSSSAFLFYTAKHQIE